MRKKIIYGLLMALGLFVAGAIGAITVTTFNIVDLIGVATAPSNPTSGKGRLYFSTADSKLHCLTNGGANCLSGGGGGGVCPAGAAGNLQYTDGTNCASTNELNYNAGGDTLLFQPAIQEYFAIGGTIQMRSGPTGANLFQIDGVNGFTIQAADTAPGNNVEFNATGEIDLSAPLIQETVGNASPVIPGSVIQRVVTAGPDTILSTDRNNRVAYNSTSAVAVSLPTAGSSGFAGGFNVRLSNQNTGTVTVTPATGTVNGAATLVLLEGQYCFVSPSSAGTSYAADCGESQETAGSNVVFTRAVHGLTIGTSLTPSFTSIGCGVLNTTSCVITGFGSTSGSATITWPAVAGTVTNPLVFSNGITSGGSVIATFNLQAGSTSSLTFASRSIMNSPLDGIMEMRGSVSTFSRLQLGGTTSSFPAIQVNGASLQAELADGSAQTGWSAATYSTETNCANGASPAVCGTAASGAVAVPTGTNPTLTINTTRVTANSRIFLSIDESLTISGVTCNTTLSTLIQPVVTARTAGTSFTIQIGAVIAANPACISYLVMN